jgi:hypothetical protein
MLKSQPLLRIKMNRHGDYEITVSSSAVIVICWIVLLALVLGGGFRGDELRLLVKRLPGF